jgi:(R,R)-butanediol dehydrogenase / meso-butanediol dehydrogenase / diacetyl reductase
VEALRWHGRQDIRLEEVDDLTESREGMSLIAVSLCGICGTDLAEYQTGPSLIRNDPHPLSGSKPPVTLGHEFVGRVLRSEVAAPGIRVTADACWRCGACDACLAGDYHLCRYGGSIGLHSDGAFAPVVAVPDYCLVTVPESVSDEAAAQTEPLAVALHALERGAFSPGDDVVVFGFGPIGGAAAMIARGLGARVIVVEKSRPRLEVADRLGFDTLEASEHLPRAVRRELGSGGAQLAVEATGSPAVIPQAVESTRRGGTIVIAGLAKQPASLDTARLTLFERSLVGSLGYRGHLPRVLALVERGVIDPAALVGEIVPLARATDTIRSLAREPDQRIKVLVDVCGDRPTAFGELARATGASG